LRLCIATKGTRCIFRSRVNVHSGEVQTEEAKLLEKLLYELGIDYTNNNRSVSITAEYITVAQRVCTPAYVGQKNCTKLFL